MRGAAGPSCRRRGSEEEIRGRMDISHALADCAPVCYAAWPATSAKVVKMKDP